ncbi:TPA: helix-turn-helix transcriptional regulator [Stenotrophomonas maltophilia]|nr:helix-turn-helix transcriptional regulator [Stenotrophomonas maltophilia]
MADEKTVRMCESEEDAIAVGIVLSGLTQAEIAARMGISKVYLTLMKQGQRTMTVKMLARFCSATGWNVVRQYRDLQMALRVATGTPREVDRIAQIAAHTMRKVA